MYHHELGTIMPNARVEMQAQLPIARGSGCACVGLIARRLFVSKAPSLRVSAGCTQLSHFYLWRWPSLRNSFVSASLQRRQSLGRIRAQTRFRSRATALSTSSRTVASLAGRSVHASPSSANPSMNGQAVRPRVRSELTRTDLDVETPGDRPTHHFYWHSFASRNQPESDPVQLWLNGGPGCSSFTGMLMELGPCAVTRASNDTPVELEYNEYSWSKNATLIFLDQPVGVGYSCAYERRSC